MANTKHKWRKLKTQYCDVRECSNCGCVREAIPGVGVLYLSKQRGFTLIVPKCVNKLRRDNVF